MPSRTVQNVKVTKRNNIHQLKQYEKDYKINGVRFKTNN